VQQRVHAFVRGIATQGEMCRGVFFNAFAECAAKSRVVVVIGQSHPRVAVERLRGRRCAGDVFFSKLPTHLRDAFRPGRWTFIAERNGRVGCRRHTASVRTSAAPLRRKRYPARDNLDKRGAFGAPLFAEKPGCYGDWACGVHTWCWVYSLSVAQAPFRLVVPVGARRTRTARATGSAPLVGAWLRTTEAAPAERAVQAVLETNRRTP